MLDMDRARRAIASYPPPYGAMQRAMRSAFGVTSTRPMRRERARRRRHRVKRREVEDCMRQAQGVDMDV